MTRVIVPISLPKDLNLRIAKQIKEKGYASKSEYFRDLARDALDRAELEAEHKKYPEFYAKLDRELEESIKQYERGEYHGPFTSIEELRRALRDLNTCRPKKNIRIKK